MPGMQIRWNLGMSVALLLLVGGGACVVIAKELGDPLYLVGVGILVLSSVVYLGSRIWMTMRKNDR